MELEEILNVILYYSPCSDENLKHSLFIVNIDETNSLFTRKKDIWLKELLVSITNVIVDYKCFIFITMTGTLATALIQSILTSGSTARTEDVGLLLLNSDQVKEVILELANRGLSSTSEAKRQKQPIIPENINLLGTQL